MSQPVVVRIPIAVRVYGVGFGLVWVGFLVVASIKSERSQVPFTVLMAVIGVALIYRIDSMKVVADGSGLFVRNMYRTWRFRWGDVEDFRPGRSFMGLPFGQVIHVLLRNGGIVTLDVTARPWVLFGAPAKFEGTLQALRGWSAGGS